jgi:putative endonuclease
MGVRSWLTERFREKPLGQRGEDAAAGYLKRLGYRILARHIDSPLGELDIIAVDGHTIVFVEVKARASTDAGHPSEAITERKEQRMTQAALCYLKAHGLLKYSARFDVVAIIWPDGERKPTSIEHYKNAFGATGRGQFFS